jgi:hypothetical protein
MKRRKCELDLLSRECVHWWSHKPNFVPMPDVQFEHMMYVVTNSEYAYEDWGDPRVRRLLSALLKASGRTDFTPPYIPGQDF